MAESIGEMSIVPQTVGDRLSRIEALTETMAGDIRDIKSELHSTSESAFPRREADLRSAELDRRLTTLETNPQRMLGWIALGVSAGGCLFTGLGVLAGLITGIIALINALK